MTHVTKIIQICVGLSLFCAASVNAALPPPEAKPLPDFEVGVLAGFGLNFSSLGSNYVNTSVSSQVGFSGGAFGAYRLGQDFTLELDAIYAYQTYNTVQQVSTISITTSVSKDVLELPLFVRYWIVPQFGIGVGPYAAFGVGNYTVAGVSEDYTNYQKKRSEFGVAGSIEGRLPVAQEANLLLDVRYLQGLTDLNADGISGDSVYDHQLEILAGISFSL